MSAIDPTTGFRRTLTPEQQAALNTQAATDTLGAAVLGGQAGGSHPQPPQPPQAAPGNPIPPHEGAHDVVAAVLDSLDSKAKALAKAAGGENLLQEIETAAIAIIDGQPAKITDSFSEQATLLGKSWTITEELEIGRAHV